MICPQCKTENSEILSFCQHCGVHLLLSEPRPTASAPHQSYRYEPGAAAQPPPAYRGYQSSFVPVATVAQQAGYVLATKPMRWLAMFIDHLLILLVIPIALIPLIGGLIAGGLIIAFWVMRDVKGASPGKQLLGLQVVSKDGQPATREALIKRNLPFAVPHILQIIPYAGIFLSALLMFPINLIEAILVVATGERIGDRIAGTMVVKK